MNINAKKRLKKRIRQGFNLMETIIWIGIVSILGGIISISSVSLIQNHKVNVANQEMGIYSAALLQYYNMNSSFPGQDEGLMSLVNNKIIDIPHKKKDLTDPEQIFSDPWNNPYIYTIIDDGQGYSLKPLGSDKKEGGNGNAKDIVLTTGESQETGETKDFKPGKISD